MQSAQDYFGLVYTLPDNQSCTFDYSISITRTEIALLITDHCHPKYESSTSSVVPFIFVKRFNIDTGERDLFLSCLFVWIGIYVQILLFFLNSILCRLIVDIVLH
jgi:hypothetical protein